MRKVNADGTIGEETLLTPGKEWKEIALALKEDGVKSVIVAGIRERPQKGARRRRKKRRQMAGASRRRNR